MTVHYDVTPVFRVTRVDDEGDSDDTVTDYLEAHVAFRDAYDAAFAERERLGLPPGDEGVQFPKRPAGVM